MVTLAVTEIVVDVEEVIVVNLMANLMADSVSGGKRTAALDT